MHHLPVTADELRAAIRWSPARPVLTVVGCHAGGEIGNVVVAGVEPPAGSTVFEQMEAIRADDSVRRLLLHEPRGSVAVHSNIVLPSLRPDCAYGYVIMEPTEYAAMSGSNTICTATVLLETGMVHMDEPVTTFRLEAPGGVVDITAGCRDGKAEWIEIDVEIRAAHAAQDARTGPPVLLPTDRIHLQQIRAGPEVVDHQHITDVGRTQAGARAAGPLGRRSRRSVRTARPERQQEPGKERNGLESCDCVLHFTSHRGRPIRLDPGSVRWDRTIVR